MMGVEPREIEEFGDVGKEYKRTLLVPSMEVDMVLLWDHLWNSRSTGVPGSPRLLS